MKKKPQTLQEASENFSNACRELAKELDNTLELTDTIRYTLDESSEYLGKKTGQWWWNDYEKIQTQDQTDRTV